MRDPGRIWSAVASAGDTAFRGRPCSLHASRITSNVALRRARTNQEHQDDRNRSSGGYHTKRHQQRHMLVAHRAETPGRETAATDADKIHDAVARRAKLWAGDLAKDRHIVRIKGAPSQAKENEEGHRHGERVGTAERN